MSNSLESSPKRTLFPGAWVPSLYFAEGLPFVCVVVVSVFMYKSMGLGDADIAFFTTLVTLPWSLKPVWSPFMEMVKTKKYFVLTTQFLGGALFGLLVLSLAPLLTASLPVSIEQIAPSLVVFALIAFNSATHDIAADGVYISSLSAKQQAQFSGWQGAAYNVGKLVAQGALVYLAGQLENTIGVVQAWMVVMGLFGVILFVLGTYHAKVLPVGSIATARPESLREAYSAFFEVLRSFLRKRQIVWGMLFVVLFRFAEGQQIKIVPLFFRADRVDGGLGLSTSQLGLAYGTFGALAFVIGSLCGGYFVAWRGLRKSLLVLCVLFNVPNAVYATLAFYTPESFTPVCAAIVVEWFGYGFGFVGVVLFMMQQIAPGPFKMAHYAFATALMNLGFMAPSAVSGIISDYLGYKLFFIWVMIATLPSFFVAWMVPLKRGEDFEAEQEEIRQADTYERAPGLGCAALLVALVSFFLGIAVGFYRLPGWPLYALAVCGLGMGLWWFASPCVAIRDQRLRLSLAPFRKWDVPVSDITRSRLMDGTWVLQLESGEELTIPVERINVENRARFEQFVENLVRQDEGHPNVD